MSKLSSVLKKTGIAVAAGNAGDNGSRNGGYTGKNKSAGL